MNSCVEMRPNLGRISFTQFVHRLQGIAASLRWHRDGKSKGSADLDPLESVFFEPHGAK